MTFLIVVQGSVLTANLTICENLSNSHLRMLHIKLHPILLWGPISVKVKKTKFTMTIHRQRKEENGKEQILYEGRNIYLTTI